MRLMNVRGRLVAEQDGEVIDVERASAGAFPSDPQGVYERWDAFVDWFHTGARRSAGGPLTLPAAIELGPPAPRPRQVFAIGWNYVDHAKEGGVTLPTAPVVFTKYVSSFTGPAGAIALPADTVDWEVELVLVIGRQAESVKEQDAWSHVAGVTVGQDLSERTNQLHGTTPQYGLAKSFPGFSPMGPALIPTSDLTDPDDLALSSRLNGTVMQSARTTSMIFPVPELIARLSRNLPLLPGDVIFTGTPPGVGMGRTPQVFLRPGDLLESEIDEIGTMQHSFVAAEKEQV